MPPRGGVELQALVPVDRAVGRAVQDHERRL